MRIFGVRHHGPGSARRLVRALEAYQPDILLIEGPPEGDKLLDYLQDPDMEPPLALLVYASKNLQQAAFYPFASFSPEWQAMQYGLRHTLPIRFMDLSPAYRWHEGWRESLTAQRAGPPPDVLGEVARAAGYAEGELWWERVIEEKAEAGDVFEAVKQLMGELRQTPAFTRFQDQENERREAQMRLTIRKAQRQKYERIAVICGAFHAPVLENMPPAKADREVLKGLRKVSTTATWVPWTYERLGTESGYGAGVPYPAWYAFRFAHDAAQLPAYWLAQVAACLREEDLPASPAQLIDALRLADALTNLRALAAPGLRELMESVQTVISQGNPKPLELIREKLLIGQKMGKVSAEVPGLPLQTDVAYWQKKLRLKVSDEPALIDLDLRKDLHLKKSQFLHRLNMLDIDWGVLEEGGQKDGSFHEFWKLKWRPRHEIQIIDAGSWGNTVLSACYQKIAHTFPQLQDVGELTRWLNRLFLADLGELLEPLINQLRTSIALESDIQQLGAILPDLVQLMRYGDVRQTEAQQVGEVIEGLLPRWMIGFPDLCVQLEEELADEIFALLLQVHHALQLWRGIAPAHEAHWKQWLEQLGRVQQGLVTHAKLRGFALRVRFDQEAISEQSASVAFHQLLSTSFQPAQAALGLEGFLYGNGLVLLHYPDLWRLMDQWLQHLPDDSFQQVLPLLRRTFSRFTEGEREKMGLLVRKAREPIVLQPGMIYDPERFRRIKSGLARFWGEK
ncbi:MAG: DUF5682 family protein [Bacteroidota bacterium]